MAGKDLDLDILPAIAAGYRHGYSMTTRAGTVPHAVTRVRTCTELAALLLA